MLRLKTDNSLIILDTLLNYVGIEGVSRAVIHTQFVCVTARESEESCQTREFGFPGYPASDAVEPTPLQIP